MRRYTILTAIMSVALMASGAAMAAQAPKIGIIDVRYIITHSKRGEAAKAALQALYNKKKASLDKERKALAAQKEAIDKTKNKKDKATQQLIAEFQQSAGEFQQHVSAGQNEVSQRESELLQPIGADLKKVVANYAKDHGYTLILNDSSQSVAFAEASYNLNDELVKALDKFEGEK